MPLVVTKLKQQALYSRISHLQGLNLPLPQQLKTKMHISIVVIQFRNTYPTA